MRSTHAIESDDEYGQPTFDAVPPSEPWSKARAVGVALFVVLAHPEIDFKLARP